MTVSKTEAQDALDVLDAFVGSSVTGAPILLIAMSDLVVTEGDLVIIPVGLDDYFSVTGAAISYSFSLANSNPLPSWLTYDATNEILTGTSPDDSAGTLVIRRTASAAGYTRFDDVTLTLQALGPSVIANPTPRQFPENAATAFKVPVTSLFSGADAYSITLADGSALPSNYAVGSLVNGEIPVLATFANNEIETHDIKITGTDTTIPRSISVYTTWASTSNPPVPGVINLTIQNDAGPQVIQIVDLSDDPAINLLVSGTVSADRGTVSGITQKEVTYTPDPSYEGDDTIYYTLEAGASGPQTAGTVSLTLTSAAQNPLILNDIVTTSQDGTPVPIINVLNYVQGGTGGPDPLSFNFVDISTGANLGGVVTIAGVGTFTITKSDNPPVVSLGLSFVSGFVGSVPPLGIECTDRAGNEALDVNGAEEYINLYHTQNASGGSPPPSSTGVEPTTADGKAITLVNPSQFKDWVLENPVSNRAHFYGLGDPVTGYIDLAPGEVITVGQLWPAGKNGYTSLDVGTQSLIFEQVPNTGVNGSTTTAEFTFPLAVELGSVGNNKRLVRTVGPSDTGSITVTAEGGANGGRIKLDWLGAEARENDASIWHPNFVTYVASRYKIFRPMDWIGVNGGKITEAVDYLDDGDYRLQQSASSFPNSVPVDRSGLKGGMQFGPLFDLMVEADCALHINAPPCLGAKSVEAEIWAAKSNQTDYNVMKNAVAANATSIFAAAEVEFRNYANMLATSCLASGYPDNTVLCAELGNETWNYGSRDFKNTAEFFAALGRHLTGTDNLGAGYGRMSAIFARALKERFAIIKPNQQLAFILNVQTGTGTWRNGQMYAAWNNYTNSVVGGASLMDCFLGLTGYLQGGWNWNNSKSAGAGNPFGSATEAEFYADWQASHQADEAAHFQTIKNWYLTSNRYKAVDAVINMYNIQLSDAIANGVGGIYLYEGGFHDIGTKLANAYPAANPAWASFMADTSSRDILNGFIAKARAINPTNPAKNYGWRPSELNLANYHDVHRNFGLDKPWISRRPDEITLSLPGTSYEAWDANLR